MKTKALILLVLITVVEMQTLSSQIRLGVKGGLNVSTHYISGLRNISKDSKNGFLIGPAIEAMLGPIGVESALLYTQKGISLNNSDISVSYFEIPLNLKFKFGLPMMKIYGTGGPYLSCGFDGKATDLIKVNISKWDIGGNIGAGVEMFNFLQVGLNYGFGFKRNDITVNNVSSYYKNGVFSVIAGIYF